VEQTVTAKADVTVVEVPQWRGSGAPTAERLREGAKLLADMVPATHRVRVDVDDDDLPETAARVRSAMTAASAAGGFVVTAGGDCGVELEPVAEALRRHGDRLVVVWFDAHGDLNTPATSPSGAFHGMVLRALTGEGPAGLVADRPLDPRRIVLAAVRDLDQGETAFIRATGVQHVTEPDPTALTSAITSAAADIARPSPSHASPTPGDGSLSHDRTSPSSGDGSPSHDHASPTPGDGSLSHDRTSPSSGDGSPSHDHTSPTSGHASPVSDHTSPTSGDASPSHDHTSSPNHSSPFPDPASPVPGDASQVSGAASPNNASPVSDDATAIPERTFPTSDRASEVPDRGGLGRGPAVYVHIDLDVLDPETFTSVGSPAPGGLQPDQLLAMVRATADRFEIAGLGITEYEPSRPQDQTLLEPLVKAVVEACAGPRT
ncbi:arginase family protein, partial [Nonomuraea sp. RK-328]|nr:arginase family protein [Nonomuraea sp. RK-328]